MIVLTGMRGPSRLMSFPSMSLGLPMCLKPEKTVSEPRSQGAVGK